MTSTHAAVVIAIVVVFALAGLWGITVVLGSRASRNAGPSKEHLERDGAYGEEGLARARARHDEHE